MTLSISVHDTLPEPETALIGEGLDAFNAAAAPLHEVVPLACFARLPSGAVVGGAVGRTWGECCELQELWVDEAQRRQGIGADLVRAFEARASARGCRTFYLHTFSFQAPKLYRSLGYEVAMALEGFAPGIVKYLMVRRVGGADPIQPVR